jgi:hypothetical protein
MLCFVCEINNYFQNRGVLWGDGGRKRINSNGWDSDVLGQSGKEKAKVPRALGLEIGVGNLS